jgi:hypothetical protein
MTIKQQFHQLNQLSKEELMMIKIIAETKEGKTIKQICQRLNKSYQRTYTKAIQLCQQQYISRCKGGPYGSYIYQINSSTADLLISWGLENQISHSKENNLFSQTDLLSPAQVNQTLEKEQVFEQLKNLLNEVLSHHQQAGGKIQQILDLLDLLIRAGNS